MCTELRRDLQHPPERYRIIDLQALMEVSGHQNIEKLQQQHCQWLSDEPALNDTTRDPAWSESLAVGNVDFINEIQTELGNKARNRKNTVVGDKQVLREMPVPYTVNIGSKNSVLGSDNQLLWNIN